jgi:hypothetical protein
MNASDYEQEKLEFNQNFNGLNVLDLLEFSHEEYDKLESNPNIENPILDEFIKRIKSLGFGKVEINKARLTSLNTDLNARELFELFKKAFYPDISLQNNSFQEIQESFNSYFIKDYFFEHLFQKYNHDEIYENPEEFDELILIEITNELKSQQL